MLGQCILLLSLGCIYSHYSGRYQGYPGLGYDKKDERGVLYTDSVAQCVQYCRQYPDCEAFETILISSSSSVSSGTTHRGVRCSIPSPTYSMVRATATTNTTMWQVKTGKEDKREVSTVAKSGPSECPTVWKHWTYKAAGKALRWKWNPVSVYQNNDGIDKIYDGNNETSFKTSGVGGVDPPYPWIQIDLKRRYLITKVAILSGEEQLMNLQVRVANGMSNIGVSAKSRQGTLCGVYYGPTLVNRQWVEVDCGLERGIKGKFLMLQLLDRYTANSPLEIAELEIYGWGRTCSTNDPDPE